MSYLTIEKVCMICEGKELKESAPGGSTIINVQEAICNSCKQILNSYVFDIRARAGAVTEQVTFNWE